jgi:hypothetical protein
MGLIFQFEVVFEVVLSSGSSLGFKRQSWVQEVVLGSSR